MPAMTIASMGYGAGDKDFKHHANVLRVIVGERSSATESTLVAVIEANIDDSSPQVLGHALERLMSAGALDATLSPLQMKKNRPGTLLTVLCRPDRRAAISDVVFRETTTIGVRYREMARECLDRTVISVDTPLGAVRIKVASRDGERLNASPEFDDCVRIARERDLPLKDVQAAAMKAFLDR